MSFVDRKQSVDWLELYIRYHVLLYFVLLMLLCFLSHVVVSAKRIFYCMFSLVCSLFHSFFSLHMSFYYLVSIFHMQRFQRDS